MHRKHRQGWGHRLLQCGLRLQHQLLGVLQEQRGLQRRRQRSGGVLQLLSFLDHLLPRGGLLLLHSLHARSSEGRGLVFVARGGCLNPVPFHHHHG